MTRMMKLCVGGIAGLMLWTGQAQANEVTDWVLKTQSVLPAAGITTGPGLNASIANVTIAQHDALNAIDRRYDSYAYSGSAPTASAQAAVHAAARGVLVRLFPAISGNIETEYANKMSLIPDSAEKTAGAAVGDAAAAAIVSLRGGDPLLSSARPPYTFLPPGPGIFQPMPPSFSAPTNVYVSLGMLYGLTSNSQFRVPAPLPLDSNLWAKDYNEVKELGALNGTTRTVDQTNAAKFFFESSVGGMMVRIAIPAVAAKGYDLWDTARTFALLMMGQSDSSVSIYESKFHYNFWRPVTAIRQGDTDGNSKTVADPTWEPMFVTPNHPETASAHAVQCSSGSHLLEKLLDEDAYAFQATSTTSPEVRSYASLDQYARDCGEARIWSGLHYRNTFRDSYATGRSIAHYLFHNFLRKAK